MTPTNQEPSLVNDGSNYTEPPIVVDAAHYKRLEGIAYGAMRMFRDVADRLLDELERAEVVSSDAMPKNVVSIGSEVTFRDEATGHTRTVQLVYPDEADITQARVSVLTPVGAALIGLGEGHRITWLTQGSGERLLRVLKVHPPSEKRA